MLEPQVIASALRAAQDAQIPLSFYLVQQNLINPGVLADIIATQFNLTRVDLDDYQLDPNLIELFDYTLLRKHLILPLQKQAQIFQIAIVDPNFLPPLENLRYKIQWLIADYQQLQIKLDALITQQKYLSLQQSSQQEDKKIIGFVQHVLSDAIQQRASDVHFEPYATQLRIRLRIDGLLHEIAQVSLESSPRIISRLKVLAKLDIAERRLPQDGRFTIQHEMQQRECRISTCPTLFGEKVVVRLLDSDQVNLQVEELGLEPVQQQLLLDCLKRPQGMLIVTGPTGSGKTVTLYTALNLLNQTTHNISTVEDPVEIRLPGINQVHVNPKIGLTFANTLRAFLRQDPDIIMIGEIRDLETAEIAIRAAQTGHFVLSTLHTNSAAETITRLMNMGIATFNLATSLNLIIAQRLVRCLCDHCKQQQQLPGKILQQEGLDPSENIKLFTAIGCKYCHQGYRGRAGVFEILPIDANITNLILQQRSAIEIIAAAKKLGWLTLRESALNKVAQGITSLTEVNRVLGHG